MSYDDRPHYEREIFLKNHLGVLLKPIVGKLSGKNAPQIKLNDTRGRYIGALAVNLYILMVESV
jgi:hypothetical protein